MAYQPDVSDEWEYWDATEEITFRSNADVATPLEIDEVTARRSDLSFDETDADGVQLQSDAVVWLLPAALLLDGADPVEPRHLDELEDQDGAVFLIQRVRVERQGRSIGHYVCETFPNKA